jgi:hypothetical protein
MNNLITLRDGIAMVTLSVANLFARMTIKACPKLGFNGCLLVSIIHPTESEKTPNNDKMLQLPNSYMQIA